MSTLVSVKVRVANGYVEAEVDDDALFVAIPHTPRQTFQRCLGTGNVDPGELP